MIAQLEKLPLEFGRAIDWIYSVATDIVGYLVELVRAGATPSSCAIGFCAPWA